VSNILKDQCTWFPVPHALYKNYHLRDLGGAAVKLYDLLMGLGQQHSAVKLELPAYIVRDFTGLTAETVASARRELQAAGLVTCTKGGHGVLTYVLLNPETHVPLPPPEGFSGFFCHRPTLGRSARTARIQLRVEPVKSTSTLSWEEIGKPVSTTRRKYAENPLPNSQLDGGRSVSTKRKIREYETENPLATTTEVRENARLNAWPSSLKPSLKKGFSELRTASKEKRSGVEENSMSCENERVPKGDPDLRFLTCYTCSEKKRLPVWYRRHSGEYFCGVCLPG
jgi:hypothetical protein